MKSTVIRRGGIWNSAFKHHGNIPNPTSPQRDVCHKTLVSCVICLTTFMEILQSRTRTGELILKNGARFVFCAVSFCFCEPHIYLVVVRSPKVVQIFVVIFSISPNVFPIRYFYGFEIPEYLYLRRKIT